VSVSPECEKDLICHSTNVYSVLSLCFRGDSAVGLRGGSLPLGRKLFMQVNCREAGIQINRPLQIIV
jgi:hypothetical protein